MHSAGNAQSYPQSTVCLALAFGGIGGGGTWFGAIYPSISQYLEDCTFTLNSQTTSFTSAGGSGTLTVSPNGNCFWTATSTASWLVIGSNSSGTGAGSVAFTVQANSGTASRTATITVGGRTVVITQAGQPAPDLHAESFHISSQRPCLWDQHKL